MKNSQKISTTGLLLSNGDAVPTPIPHHTHQVAFGGSASSQTTSMTTFRRQTRQCAPTRRSHRPVADQPTPPCRQITGSKTREPDKTQPAVRKRMEKRRSETPPPDGPSGKKENKHPTPLRLRQMHRPTARLN